MEEYATAYSSNGSIFGYEAQVLYDRTTLYLAPMVDPDGVDLVTGDLTSGVYYNKAREIAAGFLAIPFPSGWKANIDGIDLNLQYPANWDLAREIKFAQGWTRPAPRDFVGNAPLEAPESRSVYDFTNTRNFSLTLSYHTQGQVIYWQYGDEDPPRAYEIGRAFERVSGYSLQPTPPDSANAGYKDWFIDRFFRPGYTIEAGSGISPLPLSQFENIYRNNLGILTIALIISI